MKVTRTDNIDGTSVFIKADGLPEVYVAQYRNDDATWRTPRIDVERSWTMTTSEAKAYRDALDKAIEVAHELEQRVEVGV